MALGGLWHGANWTFLAWGFFHGGALALHRLFRRWVQGSPKLEAFTATVPFSLAGIILTFHCWTFSMILFRAQSIGVAGDLLRRMFTGEGPSGVQGGSMLILCAALYLLQAINEKKDLLVSYESWPLYLRVLLVAGFFWLLILLAPRNAAPFLYFQF